MNNKHHNILLSRAFQYLGIIVVVAVMGGGYWYWKTTKAAQTVESDTPSFEAPLTHTLDLARGIGTPTYSRADGADRRATVTDFEGRIIPVKQNEARFEGARRVENLLSYSQTFENAAWLKLGTGTPATATDNSVTAPDGTTTGALLDVSGATDARIAQTKSVTPGTYVFSIWLKQAGSGGTVKMETSGVGTGSALVTPTSAWKRFSVVSTVTGSGNLNIYPINRSSGGTATSVYAWGAQFEDVSGQSNQNPSEYVSTNVKTAFPYHGAGVDGVKYFDTENGNTVASNVVTEATGEKIASSTLKGYLAEGSRTNYALQSETLGTTWVPTNLTVATNSVAAPSGQTTAETLTATSSDATLVQSITGTAASYTFSVYLKRLTGTGTVSISADGTNFTSCTINSSTWTRCTDTRTLTAASYNQTIKIATSGDAVYAWGAQTELGLFASSYIPTTTETITRSYDNLKYVGASNFNNTAGTNTVDVTTEWTGSDGAGAYFISDSDTYRRMDIWHWSGSSNSLIADRSNSNGGTRNNVDYLGSTITAGTTMRLGQRWTSTAHSLFRDGSLRGSDTTLALPYDAINGISVGRRGDGVFYAYAAIKNVRSWKKALTDTEINNLTSLTQATSDSAVKETTAANIPSNTGLVGYWSFEDGSGTKAEDFSPSGANTGTLTNGPTWTDGKIGKALSFDGTDDYLRVSSLDNANFPTSGSLSLWVKGDFTTQDLKSIFYNWASGGNHIFIRSYTSVSGVQIVFQAADTSYKFIREMPLSSTQWNHIVVVWDTASDLGMTYRDGALDYSAAISDSAWVPDGQQNFFGGGGTFFNGQMDDIRLYNRILSASEIADLYAQGSTAHTTINANQNDKLTSGLVGLWSFNGPDVSGTTAYDRSGQGNNGTLVNSPTVYPGKVGQALSFDGVNDYVNIPDAAVLDPGTGDFSISAWVKVASTPTDYRRIINKGSGSNYYAFVKFPSDAWRFEFRDGTLSTGDLVFGNSTITYGTWMHLVVTVDNTNDLTSGYLDGVLKDTSSIAGYGSVSNADYLSLGSSNAFGSSFLLDEVRIYNRVLSESEIFELYNLGR